MSLVQLLLNMYVDNLFVEFKVKYNVMVCVLVFKKGFLEMDIIDGWVLLCSFFKKFVFL